MMMALEGTVRLEILVYLGLPDVLRVALVVWDLLCFFTKLRVFKKLPIYSLYNPVSAPSLIPVSLHIGSPPTMINYFLFDMIYIMLYLEHAFVIFPLSLKTVQGVSEEPYSGK